MMVHIITDVKSDYHLVIQYLARAVALLNILHPDVKIYLIDKLKSDYDLFKKRDKTIRNILLDNRVRNIV